MKNTLALTSLIILSSTLTPAWAEVEAGVGIEYMSWREYDENRDKEQKNNGARMTFNLNLTQEQAPQGWPLLAYRGRFYASQPEYQPVIPNGEAQARDSTFYGMAHEAQALIRYEFMEGNMDYILGVGWETWERTISNFAINGGDYKDEYDIYYMRLGFDYDHKKPGFHGGASVRFDVDATEDAHLKQAGYQNNPEIKLNTTLNFNAELGYRLTNTAWDLVGYYDAYSFPRSQAVNLQTNQGQTQLWRRELRMGSWGVKIMRQF